MIRDLLNATRSECLCEKMIGKSYSGKPNVRIEDRRPAVEAFRRSAVSDRYYAFAVPENRRMGSYNATEQIKDMATGWRLITNFQVSFSDQQSLPLIKLNRLTVREDETSPCAEKLPPEVSCRQ